ncbi:HNH endonuclease [bacterium]|nr:HNH endonuclease [bacterium]
MKTLHERAVALVKTYLRAETELLSVLQEIDLCKGYREQGFKSLFDYVRSLGLSENVAYNFITISRKSVQVPALKERIQDREISLSNAKVIVSILTPENQDKWLQAAAQLPKRELEKVVAKEFPERSVKETTRYVAEERVELKLGISEALLKKLKRIQDLESKKAAASLEQTLEAMADLYLQKNDPLEKAKRSKPLAPARVSTEAKTTPSRPWKTRRKYAAPLRHSIQKRDQAQCTQVTQGKRCTERRWLDIHHLKPLSQGGETTLTNLTLLCRGHHQLLHHGGRPS